jgi:ABC-type dipeptide/oligopeptide/nickel transport system permease component
MWQFTIRRFFQAVPVLFVVVSGAFLLVRLAPGSPFYGERALDPQVEEKLLGKYGLDGSLGEQFVKYWWELLQGNLGDSLKYVNRSVNEILAQTLPNSIILGSCSLFLAIGAGIVLGSLAAVYHNKWQDRIAMLIALGGICLPTFVIAPILVMLLCLWLRIFPVAGWGTISHFVLPVICLAAPYAAYCARLIRSSMLEVLNQDYIRTARAKGLQEKVVVFLHALKVALLPLVSYSGPLAAHVLTGSIVVEEIFKIPGLGTFFINSVLNRDVFVVGGTVIVYSTLLILFNAIVDVLYTVLDKRVKLS